MKRRDAPKFLAGSAVASTLGLGSVSASAQESVLDRMGFGNPANVFTGQDPVGAKPPKAEEVVDSIRILMLGVKQGPAPIDVARWFLQLTERNQDGWLYNNEWPKNDRYNPVIVGFWSLARSFPSEGDQTAWCAAFLSFCLSAAGWPGTYSPLSGTFRSYGTETTEPSVGDLVVFRKVGPDGAKGFGHVGFLVAKSDSTVDVLGGNQGGKRVIEGSGEPTTGTVNISRFPLEDALLQFHSFRRLPSKAGG